MIVRESLKEAGSETCGATNRNRIRGGMHQGERAESREALSDQRRHPVNPALVQGQPMFLPGEISHCA